MLNKFFAVAYCSYAIQARSSKSSGIEIEIYGDVHNPPWRLKKFAQKDHVTFPYGRQNKLSCMER